MPKRPKTEPPTPPDGLTFPREVTITGKAHPHHGRTGMASGESARPPGTDEDLLRIDFPDGSSCYASLFDTSVTQDLKNLTRRPSASKAARDARKKVKPPVRNGGPEGNAWNPKETPAGQAPLGESSGRKIARPSTPRCGAKNRQGQPCGNAAGFKTDHVGEGRCHLHGGKTPAPTGRYATVKRPRVRELLDQFEADPDPLNLLPEAQLLRALLTDFIERYDQQDQMLTRWNLSFERSFQTDWADWWRETRANVMETQDDLTLEEAAAEMPDPMNYLPSKPLRMADITEVGALISRVGTIIELIRKAQTQATFTMDTVNLLWKVMAGHITDAAQEVISDDDVRSTYLTAVERRFATISLAELAGRRAAD